MIFSENSRWVPLLCRQCYAFNKKQLWIISTHIVPRVIQFIDNCLEDHDPLMIIDVTSESLP